MVLLATLPIIPGQALAGPEEQPDGPILSGPKLSWDYPGFSTTDWVTTGLFAGLTIAMQIVPPVEPGLRRGLLVDDEVRDAIAVTDLQDQRTVRTVSDVLLTLSAAYPFLVDSLVVAAWYRRSPWVAAQMTLINMQTLAVTVGINSMVKVVVGRERPYGDTCGQERPDTQYDCEGNRRYLSFFSGHSSTAFASAGLICMHHMHLDLYGNRAADIGTCAAAYGVAAATGTLRIVGDQHYFSDVLLGAAVGTITGLGLPWVLHYRYGKTGRASTGGNKAIEAQLVPLANGLALSGTFDETGGGPGHGDRAPPDPLGLHDTPAGGSPWPAGRVRPFLATRLDVGFLFLKPRVSLGYGRPHDVWIGMDVNPIVAFDHVGGWGGLRGTLGWIDLRVGGRYQYSWRHFLLEPKAVYTKDDLENRVGPHSSAVSLEAELTLDASLGPGSISGEVAGTYILGVEEGYLVYEETLKVVADPPWVWRARMGYMYPLDRDKLFRIGLVAEVAGMPKRKRHTIRGGLVASVRLMRSLEARLTFMPVWYSDDDLGSAGSDLLLVGLRHRWATGVPLFH